jgi:hypothetical protein
MSFCGWSSGEIYKDHFAKGRAHSTHVVLLIILPAKVCITVPSVTSLCLTAPKSLNIQALGLPSLILSLLIVYLKDQMDQVH